MKEGETGKPRSKRQVDIITDYKEATRELTDWNRVAERRALVNTPMNLQTDRRGQIDPIPA
jgi:hypothetical protein